MPHARRHPRTGSETLRRLAAALAALALLLVAGPSFPIADAAPATVACAALAGSDGATHHCTDHGPHAGCVGHAGHAACQAFLLPAAIAMPRPGADARRPLSERDVAAERLSAPDAPPPKIA